MVLITATSIAAAAEALPATLPSIPPVTLHLQAVPREKIVEAFSQQTNIPISTSQANFWNASHWPEPTVNIDFDNEPFWVALGHLQEAAQIGFTSEQGKAGFIATMDRGDVGWTGRPEIVSGSVLFSVRRVERSTTVTWADATHPADELMISILGQPEPGCELKVDQDGFAITECTDESGQNLLPAKPFAEMARAYESSGRLNLTAMIPVAADAARKSIVLAGTLRCVVAADKTTIDLPDAEKEPATRDVAGFPVTIAVQRKSGGLRVDLSGSRPAQADAVEYERFLKRLNDTWIADIQLTDSAGKSVNSGGGGATLYKDRISMYRIFEATGLAADGALRLTWTVPTAVSTVILPLRFDQIPVP